MEGKSIETRVKDLENYMTAANPVLQAIQEKGEIMNGLWEDVTLLKKALAKEPTEASVKLRVPEPKAFMGGHDTKELENFLWDIKAYFKATHTLELEKVTLASMFLAGIVWELTRSNRKRGKIW